MQNDYLTDKNRLIFTQSKHDKTDKAFLVAIGCLAVIEVLAQIVIAVFGN